MSEKPYHKPEDDVILAFKDHAVQPATGSAAPVWAGTDLARFAQDVVALNSRSQDTHKGPRCQVASLDSMQKGLKINKKPADEAEPEGPVNLSRFRKE
jgi:hypothetical protein